LCGALLVNGGAALDRRRACGHISLERAFMVGRPEELSCV
jgi:hypothetical protein